jgi:hypothetical protein
MGIEKAFRLEETSGKDGVILVILDDPLDSY